MAVVSAHLSKPAPAPSAVLSGPAGVARRGRGARAGEEPRRSLAGHGGVRPRDGAGRTRSAIADGRAVAGGGLLGTYEIGEPLGPGRLGSTVHRGVHRALGHPVAIRILRGVTERDEAARERFLHEARALQVAHPSIIQVRDYGEEGDLVYLVTDFIEGPSMRQLLTECGALPWPRLSPLRDAAARSGARAAPAQGPAVRPLARHHPHRRRRRRRERLMISSAGIWDAQDLLATLQEQTLRGMALADVELRYVAPELFTGRDGRRPVRRLHAGRAGLRDGDRRAAVRRRDAAGAAGQDAERARRAIRASCSRRCRSAAAAAIQTALSSAPEKRFASAREFLAALRSSRRT